MYNAIYYMRGREARDMEKEKFDLGRLDSGYLAERSGTALDGETADRLDLWCEDMVKAMAPDPADSVSMAKRTASLWRELGIIWPADGSGGIRGVQGEMLRWRRRRRPPRTE